MKRLLTITLIAILIAGCGQNSDNETVEPAADTSPPTESPDNGIQWFDGSVEQAFATAATADKPIFLYWGAEWCPYCKQVKATVFTRRDFIDRSRLFVPVYLDGDAEEAQRIGEQFRVYGYPTMIVFGSDGTEITRIPEALDVEVYATILDLALTAVRPVKAIVTAVLDGETASGDDYQRLAYYSWSQDNEGVLAGRDQAATYAALPEHCPDTVAPACMRLYLRYLLTVTDEPDEEEAPPATLSREQRQAAIAQLTTLLNEASLIQANLDTILLEGPDLVAAITEAGAPARADLTAQWLAVLERLANDASITTVERLYASSGPAGFLHMNDADATIPATIQDTVANHVERADRETTDPIERHAVISTAGSVLRAAELHKQAAALLQTELERSAQPYYFMSYLARAAAREGLTDKAIAWRKRAYDESSGESTRFRWGYGFVAALIQLTPEDTDTIETATTTLFNELTDPRNAFFGTTRVRAKRLSAELEEWSVNDDRKAAIDRIRSQVQKICTGIPGDDVARSHCDSFLSET